MKETDNFVKSSFGWLELVNYSADPIDTNSGRYGLAFVSGSLKYWNGTAWAAVSGGGSTNYDDIGNPDANKTIAFAGYTNVWTSTMNGGTVFAISNTTADVTSNTYLLDLKFADDGDANGFFFRCLDNSGADAKFTIAADGATTIAGVAAGTSALTLTAGDLTLTSGHLVMTSGNATLTSGNLTLTSGNLVLTSGNATLTAGNFAITSGNIDVNEGKIEVDTATDITSYIKRNQGATTGPVFKVWEAAAAADNAAIFIDQDATAAASYGLDIDSEGGTAIHASVVAAGVGIHLDVADSYTARAIYLDLGPWLGTANQGAIELVTDNAATVPAGKLMVLNQQGTGQHAAAIAGSSLYVNDTATAPAAGTSYAVSINASSIAALQVVGASQFTGAITVGVDDTGHDVKLFGATTAKYLVWDESGDRLILTDATSLQVGGDESTAEFLISFDGTATLSIDASTANDKIAIGATTATDVEFNGATAGRDMTWDASEDSLVFNADASLIIPAAAGTHANQKEVAGSMYFETDVKKLWIYDGATWVGVVLA